MTARGHGWRGLAHFLLSVTPPSLPYFSQFLVNFWASFILQFTLLARRSPFVLSLSKDVNPHRSLSNKPPFDKLRANGEPDVSTTFWPF